jgi:hypothetical protein
MVVPEWQVSMVQQGVSAVEVGVEVRRPLLCMVVAFSVLLHQLR